MAAAIDRYGRIDVVFNNAGIESEQQPLHEMSIENWDRVTRVNGSGAFHVLKYGIAALLESGGGSVVNMASETALSGHPNLSPYTFAKAGLVGLTRSAAIEYADRGIRVNAVAPTAVMTPLVRRHIEQAPDPAAMRALVEGLNPMPGIPEPSDVAGVVAFLASDDARWITGVTIPIDGGRSAG